MTDTSWQPDGWDLAARIGVLTSHADVGPESELRAMAPPMIGIYAARVPLGAMAAGGQMDLTIPLAPVRAFAEPPYVDQAAGLLAAAPLDAIGFGFTSSAYVIGAVGEEQMIRRLESLTRGIPVVTPCAATVRALELLGAGRIALIDPPWFDRELNSLGQAYYSSAGLDVTWSAICGLASDQRAITPEGLHGWAIAHVPEEADAVLIGGNGFRAVGAVAALERDLGRPVLTANQVLLWAALRAAGTDTGSIRGYGRVFDLR